MASEGNWEQISRHGKHLTPTQKSSLGKSMIPGKPTSVPSLADDFVWRIIAAGKFQTETRQ